ncbi:hypothetical protein SELMODRAFT_443549 [Selaginella moellendorffii]|uniref:Methyltransferase n=1 Tax=Selaginella moellendorffii TaxID=88036 RepID=D8S250_SELML|nr:hypothetical protein SELMODRAFT_443549 [Selaginella moellendorffii]
MGKDFPASPKLHAPGGDKRCNLSWIFGAGGLCFFFYILGAWQQQPSSTVKIDTTRVHLTHCDRPEQQAAVGDASSLDFSAHHAGGGDDDQALLDLAFDSCALKFSEYTPCEDIERSLRFDRDRLIYRERHCPAQASERLRCLIPAPPGYRNPFPWPKSRDFAWYANVPHKELTVEKAVQNWIQYEGDRFKFPGGGTMFPKGADAYIDDIGKLVPLKDGSIRTALDTGCGVASFGAFLLSRNVLTMSFAPRDTHEGQVQFALERGVPAMLGVMASQRLLYPARAFDLAHCSRCLIPWKDYGYWVLSGPPVNWQTHWKGWQRTQEDLLGEMTAIEELAKALCWKKVVERGNLAVWRKPTNHYDCVRNRKKVYRDPPICKAEDADEAWYKPMQACITPLPAVAERSEVSGGKLAKWPSRATEVPPRVATGLVPGITPDVYEADTKLWNERVGYYKNSVIPPLGQGRYRNIMDMNAGLGGFAAAFANDNRVWVMNAVPPFSSGNADVLGEIPQPSSFMDNTTLGVIYERGFIGVYHDWCEAFSTYPRTYDFIHANRVFSMYRARNKCDLVDILLEMDRILRPEGAVIIRDEVDVLNKVKRIASGMKWESRMVDHETGPFNREKILVSVKSYWVGESSG